MTVPGIVTRWRERRSRAYLIGSVQPRAGEQRREVVLRAGELELARTFAEPRLRSSDGVLHFAFSLAGPLKALIASGHDLHVLLDGERLPMADAVREAAGLAQPDPAALEQARRQLDEGYLLTTKGKLAPPFSDRGGSLDATLDHYARCSALVEEILGYRLHVVGGTFLGVLREGGAIAHDFDVDTAFLSRHSNPAKVKAEFVRLIHALIERGETLRFLTGGKKLRRNYFMWFGPQPEGRRVPRPQIDLFPAYVDRRGYYCRPTFVRIPGGRAMIEPLQQRPFSGHLVWAPADMEAKAERVFGANWRTPDPFWQKPKFPGVKRALAPLRLTGIEFEEIARLMNDAHGRDIVASVERSRAARAAALAIAAEVAPGDQG